MERGSIRREVLRVLLKSNGEALTAHQIRTKGNLLSMETGYVFRGLLREHLAIVVNPEAAPKDWRYQLTPIGEQVAAIVGGAT